MSARALALLAALAALPCRAGQQPAAWPHEPLLHGAAEQVLHGALIPSPQSVHGEVVVARRGEDTCVETILCSPILGRGLAAIRRKEQERWPASAEGHADSVAFLAALDRTEDAVRAEFLARANPDDDRRKMLMELVLGRQDAFFALYAIDARRRGDHFEVLSARPVVVQDASRTYVEGAMRAEVGSAFHADGPALEALLSGR